MKKCPRCLHIKNKVQKASLVSIHTTYPLELVCIDFLTLEPSRGVTNVITDHYTKYALACPTRNQTSKTTAEVFFNEFVTKYGVPTIIHSDQGANFEGEIVREMCKLMDVKKSRTTQYHPKGNAGPQRFNRTLLDMLGTLDPDRKQDWKSFINPLVYAYKCTPHEGLLPMSLCLAENQCYPYTRFSRVLERR